mgnify:CR=1 FL=1
MKMDNREKVERLDQAIATLRPVFVDEYNPNVDLGFTAVFKSLVDRRDYLNELIRLDSTVNANIMSEISGTAARSSSNGEQ